MNKIRMFMEVTDNRIGYNGGIYRAVAKGDDCIVYKPNEDSIVVGIDTKEAGQINVFTSSMNIKKVDVKQGLTYFLLKNPAPVKDFPASDVPSLEMRKVTVGGIRGGLNKLFFDNITIDSNNLQISGYNSWVDDIALPKPGVGYFSMSQIRGRFDLDLTDYKCYRLQKLGFNSIKIGKMGNPLVSDSYNSYTNIVYLGDLNNVVEFGGLEPNIKTVYITYCDDTTILSVLRGIDGHSATAGYVDVEISLKVGQEITDEMNTIAAQNGINIY